MAHCIVAMKSNGNPPPTFAFNTPMLTATNAPLNIPRPQPAPKSRRMRPTKSITPRYVHIFPCQRPVLLFIYSGISVLLIGVRKIREQPTISTNSGTTYRRKKKTSVEDFCHHNIRYTDQFLRDMRPNRRIFQHTRTRLLNLMILLCLDIWQMVLHCVCLFDEVENIGDN